MITKRIILMATAAVMAMTSVAIAQPAPPPPGNDPYGYYSQYDQQGYYDRQGHYQRMRDRDRDRGLRVRRHRLLRRALIMSKGAMSRIAIAVMLRPVPSSARWQAA